MKMKIAMVAEVAFLLLACGLLLAACCCFAAADHWPPKLRTNTRELRTIFVGTGAPHPAISRHIPRYPASEGIFFVILLVGSSAVPGAQRIGLPVTLRI
jgi:hypothetical protein